MRTPRPTARAGIPAAVLTLLLICAPAGATEAESSELPAGYHQVGDDRTADLDRLSRAHADTGLFTGAVLVADEGGILYQQAFGMANREWSIDNTIDTKFRLASVSKPFCALLVMQLVQEGKFALDDTISDHLSYYRSDTGERITIHHLLAHQSGLPDYTASFDYRGTISRLPFDPDEFIRQHCSGDLQHEPGAIYAYCNAGYSLLGRIIEKVTRKSYERNLVERIFEPLGMGHSGYDRNRYLIEKRASGYSRGSFGYENADYIDMDSSPGAAGALYSTVGDLFLFDRALHTDELLDAEHRRLMFTPNRDVPEVAAAGGRAQSVYGYGWRIFTRRHPVTDHRTKFVSHGGAIHGFRALVHRLVDDDALVVVLCNQGDAMGGNEVWNAVTNLSHELAHIVTGQPYRLPGKPPVSQDQRLYSLVTSEGVDAAVGWFEEKGKPAAWGGTFAAVAAKLIEDGLVEEGLQLMDYDLEQSSNKVWLLRQTAEAFLANGRPARALELAEKALGAKPDDERLEAIRAEAESDLAGSRGRPD